MNILITGASGFIGSNLLKTIKHDPKYINDKVILLASRELKGYLCVNHNSYTFTKEDFDNKGISEIDVVIHLGAFTPKTSKEVNDAERSISNIVNTEYLLQNFPNLPQKFIFLSTIDVYGMTTGVISEESVTAPTTLYGHSKLFAEKLVSEWATKNEVIFQILRIGHIYGEGEDEYQKIIPSSIKQIINDAAPVVYSDGQEKRTYLYIDDCCRMILKSIELEEYKEPINIVGSSSISILDLINLIIGTSKKKMIPIVQNCNANAKDVIFNNEKMIKYFGKESTLLQEGIKREYEYFEKKYN